MLLSAGIISSAAPNAPLIPPTRTGKLEETPPIGTYRWLDMFPTFRACQEQAQLFERIAGEGIGLYCLPEDDRTTAP